MFAQITSKKLKLDSLPQTHLVFLIDVSGSMDMPNRLPVLKEGFKSLAKNLRAKDSVIHRSLWRYCRCYCFQLPVGTKKIPF